MGAIRAGLLGVLVVVAGCAKHPATDHLDGGGGWDGGGSGGGGGERTGCASDSECSPGMVCEGCASGEFSCVPGCRTNSQCRLNFVCAGPVACKTCPCPPGWCEPDPCLDLDNDGYVQSCDPKVVCPGK